MKLSRISTIIKSGFFLLMFLSGNLIAQDNDTIISDTMVSDLDSSAIEAVSPFDSYFEPLSSSEAEGYYDQINTEGKINNYRNVPDNRSVNDSRISDPHYIFADEYEDSLNALLKMVETETGYQMAVVCLNSIGDNDPTTYAHDLFNHWGIGEAGKDNGFLCLVINDIHRVEFANGYGTEQVLSDLQGEDIRQNEMIPHFKNNDYTTGIFRGMQAVADVFYGVPPDYYSEIETSSDYSSDYYDSDYDESGYSTPFYKRPLIRFYIKLALFLTGAWLIVLIISFLMKDYHKRYNTLKFFTLLIFPIMFPVPFLGLYFVNKWLMNKWRNAERFSHLTGEFMIKLSESEDDEFLAKGQIKEEVLKSIDYDVWITPDMKTEVLVLAYKSWFSKYRKCPKCKHKTYNKDYDRVITAATYSSSGRGERKYSCKNCSHSKITTYTIPKKVKSSSGGYSSSGSSYSGGSSYSSGSSSSGGSSWGGGSSGGGGGGSSW